MRTGRSAEILNNPDKYNTYTLEDCNSCANSVTKYKGVGSAIKKPSNISKSLGRDAKDSHSFGRKGGRRNYSTSWRHIAKGGLSEGWPTRETLILLESDDLKNEGIPAQGVDYNFEKYNALTPFKHSSLLSPIILTKTLLYCLDKSEDCLSKLSSPANKFGRSASENLVKRFLLDMLEEKFKITVKLVGEWRNLLNNIKLKDPYIKEPIYQKVDGKLIHTHTYVIFTKIDFYSFHSNIFKLSKIYGRLEGRFVNNSFEFIEVKKDKSLFDNYKFIPCGCYVIYSKKTLYYYIGYSTNIIDRLHTHYLNLKSLKASRLGDL